MRLPRLYCQLSEHGVFHCTLLWASLALWAVPCCSALSPGVEQEAEAHGRGNSEHLAAVAAAGTVQRGSVWGRARGPELTPHGPPAAHRLLVGQPHTRLREKPFMAKEQEGQ